MKYFISQPMNNKTAKDIRIERARIAAMIKMIVPDAQILSGFVEEVPDGTKPMKLLGSAIQILSDADVAVFANGWDHARGCVVERAACMAYNIPIVDEKDLALIGTIK